MFNPFLAFAYFFLHPEDKMWFETKISLFFSLNRTCPLLFLSICSRENMICNKYFRLIYHWIGLLSYFFSFLNLFDRENDMKQIFVRLSLNRTCPLKHLEERILFKTKILVFLSLNRTSPSFFQYIRG